MTQSYVSKDHLFDLRREPLAYITVIFILLAFISIILRAWAQWGTERAWSWILIAAMVLLATDGGINITMLHYGYGAIHSQLSPELYKPLFKLAYAIGIVYPLALTFAKLSILQFYLRIFEVHKTKIWIMLLAGLSIAACAANVFTVIFQCSPVRRAWFATPEGTCINVQKAFAGFALVNIALDVVIPIVPAFGVAKMNASVGKRTLAIFMLVLGSITVVASAIRLYLFFTNEGRLPPDRAAVRLTTWSAIEASVAVMSSCLPLLKPLALKAIQKVKNTTARSEHGRSDQSLTAPKVSPDHSGSQSTSYSNADTIYCAELADYTEKGPDRLG